MTMFMFATGIENSNPMVGGKRVDELEKCGHYKYWRTDFDLTQALGIHYLRYGPPLHTTWLGDGRYDWSFADETFADIQRRDIVPIVDLCHFGVPDWIGDFQNPDFAVLFARYAGDFAARFPLGAAVHAGQRDVHRGAVLRQIRLVERGADHRSRVRHRAEAHRPRQRVGDAGDPRRSTGRHLHPVGSNRVFPRRRAGSNQGGGDLQLAAVPKP